MKLVFYRTVGLITFRLCRWVFSIAEHIAVICESATNRYIEKDLERQRKQWS